MTKLRLAALMSVGMATVISAAPVYADTIYQLNEASNFTSGDLLGSIGYGGSPPNYPPVTFNGNVYIGPLNMNVVNQTTMAIDPLTVYCTDIFHEFVPGGLYTLSATNLTAQIAAQIGSSADAATKVNQINALLNNTFPTGGAAGAAVQAAIWEIENEPGVTGYDVASGLFTASVDAADQLAFTNDVQGYLANVTGGLWQPNAGQSVWEFVVAQGQSPNQTFSFIASSGGGNNVPLPEPASLGVLGLGVLGLGAFRIRRGSTR